MIIFDSFPAASMAEEILANVKKRTNEIAQILFNNKKTPISLYDPIPISSGSIQPSHDKISSSTRLNT